MMRARHALYALALALMAPALAGCGSEGSAAPPPAAAPPPPPPPPPPPTVTTPPETTPPAPQPEPPGPGLGPTAASGERPGAMALAAMAELAMAMGAQAVVGIVDGMIVVERYAGQGQAGAAVPLDEAAGALACVLAVDKSLLAASGIRLSRDSAGGPALTTVDFARLGQLVADAPALKACHAARDDSAPHEGWGWWRNRLAGTAPAADPGPAVSAAVRARWAAGGRIAPAGPDGMLMASGQRGQRLFVLPDERIAFAIVGGRIDEAALFERLFATSEAMRPKAAPSRGLATL